MKLIFNFILKRFEKLFNNTCAVLRTYYIRCMTIVLASCDLVAVDNGF